MAPFSAANLYLLLLLAALLASCNPDAQNREAPRSALFAGAASTPINPPTGAFIAGDRPDRRFTGVHDSIYVKAAVFSDGETPPAYSFLSRELMDSEPTFVLGLAMDAMGYILKPAYFDDPELPHAAYLTSMSPGREAGPLVAETLKALIPKREE